MYNLQLTEEEINLVWSILSNSNIAGKFAPALSVIFNKLQDSVRIAAIQQQREKMMQEQNTTAPITNPSSNSAAEEKLESF